MEFIRADRSVAHPVVAWGLSIIAVAIAVVFLLILNHNRDLEAAYANERTERGNARMERDKAAELADSISDSHQADEMVLASHAQSNGNIAQACRLVEAQIPGKPGDKDRRGWEWHFLGRATSGGNPVLRGHDGPLLSVACHPAGKIAVTGGKDGTARVWNIETGRPLWILKGHRGLVRTVAFSPDGKLIATAGDDATAVLWESSQTSRPAGPKAGCTDHGRGCPEIERLEHEIPEILAF